MGLEELEVCMWKQKQKSNKNNDNNNLTLTSHLQIYQTEMDYRHKNLRAKATKLLEENIET